MKFIILNILSLFFIYGCNQDEPRMQFENYNKNAAELISQILSKDIDCGCIIEPVKNADFLKIKAEEMPEYDFENDLYKALNINSDKTLASLIKLSDEFIINESMINSDVKLIRRAEFDITITREGTEEKRALQQKCPCKYFISKPIFDKEFKSAVVSIGIDCGPWCGNGGWYIYNLKNGIWESNDGFAIWIN